MEELELSPMVDELSKATDSLAHGKATAKDGMPSEVIQYRKPTPLGHFHELLCL